MSPKSNLSRFSFLAALGVLAAVLGGCAESTAGNTSLTEPLSSAREEIARTRFENPSSRVASASLPSEALSTSSKLSARVHHTADAR